MCCCDAPCLRACTRTHPHTSLRSFSSSAPTPGLSLHFPLSSSTRTSVSSLSDKVALLDLEIRRLRSSPTPSSPTPSPVRALLLAAANFTRCASPADREDRQLGLTVTVTRLQSRACSRGAPLTFRQKRAMRTWGCLAWGERRLGAAVAWAAGRGGCRSACVKALLVWRSASPSLCLFVLLCRAHARARALSLSPPSLRLSLPR